MGWRRCPEQEALLEYVSIPAELSLLKRGRVHFHVMFCENCRERIESVRASWEAYLKPEPDITSSLLRVYSSLQKDETLVLKGWKLDEIQPRRDLSYWLFQRGWLFRGGLSLGAVAMALMVIFSQLAPSTRQAETLAARRVMPARAPLAQIRVEDRNTVKVQYVQPELLESMEFETTSAAR